MDRTNQYMIRMIDNRTGRRITLDGMYDSMTAAKTAALGMKRTSAGDVTCDVVCMERRRP